MVVVHIHNQLLISTIFSTIDPSLNFDFVFVGFLSHRTAGITYDSWENEQTTRTSPGQFEVMAHLYLCFSL